MINAHAREFHIGVTRGQELVGKCNVCNQVEMDNIFGDNWNDSGLFNNLSMGKRMKWNISSIMSNEINITINVDIWGWTSEKIWSTKDFNSQITYFSNPDDYSQVLNFSFYSSFVPFWFPVPVGDYIGGLSLNEWYDVDNRVLPTLNVDLKENALSPGIPTKDIKIIAIYNDQGILNSYKIYLNGYIVILDISFDFLPIYVIPTLIGLLCIFTFSLIFYIFRKRKRVKN